MNSKLPHLISDITHILVAAEKGDPRAAEQLLPLVYSELRNLATARMAREAPGQTLQPTALVHEAWLRLVGSDQPAFEGRAHFFAAAAEAMRRILIDRARRRNAQRHGGNHERIEIDQVDLACPLPDDQLLAINESLDRFAAVHPRPAELLKLRYFAGMTVKEASLALGISIDTAKDYSAFARAWLFRDLKRQET